MKLGEQVEQGHTLNSNLQQRLPDTSVSRHFGIKSFLYQHFGSEVSGPIRHQCRGVSRHFGISAKVSPTTSALVPKCPHTLESFE